MINQFSLFKTKRFWPIFVTQFGGAFNDNLFKAAVSVMIAYGLIQTGAWQPEVLVSLATAAFIIPFVICAPFAGYVADHGDKARIIRSLKWMELLIAVIAVIGLTLKSIPILIGVLVLLGAQSAFFSPCKFGILPQHLDSDEMIGANGLINTSTYLAILFGTICGSLLIATSVGLLSVSIVLITMACVGIVSSYVIPRAPPPPQIEEETRESLGNILRQTWIIVKNPHNGLFKTLIASGWFFFMAAIVMAQLPNVTGRILFANQAVLAMFFIVFAAGVSVGGLMNNQILKGAISIKLVWIASLLSAVFSADFFLALDLYQAYFSSELQTPSVFLAKFSGWRILLDLFILSFLSGLYIVPVKTFIQHHAPAAYRGQILAMNAMIDALFIIVSSLLSAALLALGLSVAHLFLMLGVGFGFVGVYLMSSRKTEGTQ